MSSINVNYSQSRICQTISQALNPRNLLKVTAVAALGVFATMQLGKLIPESQDMTDFDDDFPSFFNAATVGLMVGIPAVVGLGLSAIHGLATVLNEDH